MQAPVVPVGPAPSAYPTILPGPFILLLALPAIPLLLFSIGARPPDTSSLPFSTDDLWQTTVFISLAGGVMLAAGLYPGMMSDVGSWVALGDGDGWSKRWFGDAVPEPVGQGTAPERMARGVVAPDPHMPHMPQRYPPSQPVQQQQQQQQQQQYQDQAQRPGQERGYIRLERPKTRVITRPPQIVQDRHGNKWWRPGNKIRVPVHEPIPHVVHTTPLESRIYPNLAARHLAYLREGPLGAWYSTDRPPAIAAVLIMAVLVAALVVLTGKILGGAYDTDKSGGSSGSSRSKSSSGSGSGSRERGGGAGGGGGSDEQWYTRELGKRKSEDPKVTEKRSNEQNKEFVGRLKKMDGAARAEEVRKRKSDLDKLKKELEKRKMPLVGLEWDFGDGKTKGKSKGEKGKEADRKAKGKGADKEKAGKGGKEGKEGKSVGSRMKNLLGSKDKSDASTPPADGGPGWRPADDAVAHAAIRGGAARAENLANSLVAKT